MDLNNIDIDSLDEDQKTEILRILLKNKPDKPSEKEHSTEEKGERRKIRRRKKKESGNKKRNYGITLPFEAKPRPNKFLELDIAKSPNTDKEIDQKLWGKNQPTTRMGRATLVEAECQNCGRESVISERLLRYDPENGEEYYICDACIVRNRNAE